MNQDATRATGPPGPQPRTLDRPMPVQRAPQNAASSPSQEATVLVADPRPGSRVALSMRLHRRGICHVQEATSLAQVHAVIASAVPGDLALISLQFGDAAVLLIQGLRRAGWPRVLATTRGDDPDPVIRAFRAGAGGVLLGPPVPPHADTAPITTHQLADHEVE